jgi:hypothetical protein
VSKNVRARDLAGGAVVSVVGGEPLGFELAQAPLKRR